MSTESTDAKTNAARTRELNDTIRYTMWSVFRLRDVLGDADRSAEATDVEALFEVLAEQDVKVRGLYDVSGLRADADLMVWWHAADSEQLQAAYNAFRRTSSARKAGMCDLLNSAGRCSAICDQTGSRRRPKAVRRKAL